MVLPVYRRRFNLLDKVFIIVSLSISTHLHFTLDYFAIRENYF